MSAEKVAEPGGDTPDVTGQSVASEAPAVPAGPPPVDPAAYEDVVA